MVEKSDTKTNLKMTFRGIVSVWRVILFLVSLGIILPLSLSKIQSTGFYYSIFGVCAGIMLLSFLTRIIASKIKKVKINFIKNYVGIMFNYGFITLGFYFVTYLFLLYSNMAMTYIFMVISSIALSLTISRAKFLLVFI